MQLITKSSDFTVYIFLNFVSSLHPIYTIFIQILRVSFLGSTYFFSHFPICMSNLVNQEADM